MRRLAPAAAILAAAVLTHAGAQEPGGPQAQVEPRPAAPSPEEVPPISWTPWSEEAIEKTRESGRAILLTIVSRDCRPCDKADATTFADPIVRMLVARRWKPIRVDRDDRPDLDARYQTALAALTKGRTGYPLVAFLFPTAEVIWADLVMPAEDYEDRPGMRSLLVRMDDFWKDHFSDAKRNAEFVEKAFEEEDRLRRASGDLRLMADIVVDNIVAKADGVNGGYGDAPRIQNPAASRLVLLAGRRRADPGLRAQALAALRGPVRGALYDRVSGGFHAGVRGEGWEAPWFDKPLEANAQYLTALVDAIRSEGEEASDLREPAGRTIDFVLGTLRAPDGTFYVEQAASADPADDAAAYAWKVDEARDLFGDSDLKWARALLGIRDGGIVLLGLPARFTLAEAASPAEAAASVGGSERAAAKARERILSVLEASRRARPVPPVVETRFVASNASMASALLQAGHALGREDALAAARRALDALLAASPRPEAGVPHRLGPIPLSAGDEPPPLLADLSTFGEAMLDGWEALGDPRYLEAAKRAGEGVRTLYLDAERGGFFDVPGSESRAGYERLRRRPILEPSGRSSQASAARLLDRLAEQGGGAPPEESFAALVAALSRLVRLDARAAPLALAAKGREGPAISFVIRGSGSGAEALARAVHALYEPRRVVTWRDKEAEPSVTICRSGACGDPVVDPAAVAKALVAAATPTSLEGPGSL